MSGLGSAPQVENRDRHPDQRPADIAMARAEWQDVVFASRPRRLAVLGLHAEWPLRRIRVSVLRNHAVETTMSVLRGFLAYAGYEPVLAMSGYDDALSTAPDVDADVHVVWVDTSRYADTRGIADWFAERLTALRRAVRGPIIVVDALCDVPIADRFNAMLSLEAARLPDVHIFPLSRLMGEPGGEFRDTRVAETGTSISGAGATLIGQHLGLRWLPAVMRPRLKAIIVDLDNTLVGGVLGEDGVAGVDIAGGYELLRARLLELHASGLLLALVSKNDRRDVVRLFEERTGLQEIGSAFFAIEAGWGSKSESVMNIINRLRIGTESALIVDDNAGEIAAMAATLGDPWFVLASDPDVTTRALRLHPGLLALHRDDLADWRGADLAAAERRVSGAKSAADPSAYVASLDIRMDLRLNPLADRTRLSELSRKTNQFNTTLTRFSEAEVDDYLHRADRCVVSARLRDRLSDSGTIAAVFARRVGGVALIDEIAISCRALGRALEPVLLAEVLGRIAGHLEVERIQVRFVEGPRNGPARAWLDAATSVNGEVNEIASATLVAIAASLPVDVRWTDDAA
jgi:FkbH-like protein